MKKKEIGIILGVALVAGVVSFYAGVKYEAGSLFANRQARGQQFLGMGAGNFSGQRTTGGRAGGGVGFVSGEVIAKDDKTITVKLSDGGSKIVFFSENMPVMKSTTGFLSDISVGEQVMINGTSNQDGSLNAQSVQIRPEISNTQAGN